MMEAFSKYLNKQALYPALISEKPSERLKHIIIIPAYNEPDILQTIKSIIACDACSFDVEIIVLINHTVDTDEAVVAQNEKTQLELTLFAKDIQNNNIKLHSILLVDLVPKHAGAGLARKIAMDEAVRRFVAAKQNLGTIISLDADTLVSKNYLVEIEQAFQEVKKVYCTIFNFEHRLEQEKYGKYATDAILKYELYLRYYKEALKYTGFPYAYFTIGSCFAVSAEAYIKQGGMNRKQAGEDFYFLQKIFPLGKTRELNHVTVYPSSRPSDRVPFGTGPSIIKIAEEGELLTYQFEPFSILRSFFANISPLYKSTNAEIESYYNLLDPSLKSYIGLSDLQKNINEINNNSASLVTFEKKFFNWFNALKVIQYLNVVHENLWDRKPIEEVAQELIRMTKQPIQHDTTKALLTSFKKMLD